MSEPTQLPLVRPAGRRGWRDIAHFRPLADHPQIALVLTRQGRLVGIIPAGGRRVLSDYVTWPYDIYEVDMRERSLLLDLQLESREPGYTFQAALRLTYQVDRPERVALELEDAFGEFERAIVQTMRSTSRSFGVEQARALEEHLGEALLYSDVLRDRLADLGIVLRRADVAVTLDEPAWERAQDLLAHTRERPLLAQLTVESLDPELGFDVQVGGFYRLTSRGLGYTAIEEVEAAIREAIARSLRRVGIQHPPQDYRAAARAMAEALRYDAVLQAELATVDAQLVRSTVQIQPDRRMVTSEPQTEPPPPPAALPTSRPWPGDQFPAFPNDTATEAPAWSRLRQALDHDQQEAPQAVPPAEAQQAEAAPALFPSFDAEAVASTREALRPHDDSDDSAETSAPSDDALAEIEALFSTSLASASNLPQELLDEAAPEDATPNWTYAPDDAAHEPADMLREQALGDTSTEARETLFQPMGEPDQPERAGTAGDDVLLEDELFDLARAAAETEGERPGVGDVAEPGESIAFQSQIDRWLALLHSDGPGMFKLRRMELLEQPEQLTAILVSLTDDPAVLARSNIPEYQRALVHALATNAPVTPAQSPQEPDASPPEQDNDAPPDWMRLRQTWNDSDGGAA